MKRQANGIAQSNQRDYPGVISIHEVYTLEEAKARLRWSDSAFRAAKRRGLEILSCGKRRYVAGQDILHFLRSTCSASANAH